VKTTGAAALAVVLVLAGCSAATPVALVSPAPTVTEAAPDERIAPSDALMAAMFDPAQPGCSAAVGVHGRVLWAGAVGTADLAKGSPLTTETRFDIASLTKQFTATAILMLQRQGAVSLSDPIGSYVPGLPSTVRSITLDALMHHTSHIPDYWVKLDEWGYGFTTPATQADALRAIAAVSRLDKGSGYLYSNSNYILLAEVISAVTGVPYAQYLDDAIFTPLGLDLEIDPVLQAPDVAVGYDDALQPTRNAWAFYGAFGTFTTPTELARWGDQYRDGGLVQNDFVAGAVDSGTAGEASEGRLYAAGMNINPDGSLRHDGRLGGFISAIKISPDRETTVVVMCNAHLADRSGLVDGLWAIWVDPQPGGD
jgi:CubicO group peptidase (beta-lactamase class C family)